MAIETGTRVTSATAHGKNGHSLISNAKFRQLYELAFRLQRAGEREERLRGREAALAGVAADLQSDDVVVAEYAASLEDIERAHPAPGLDRRSFDERVIEALSDAVGDRMRKTGRITAIFIDGTQTSKVLEEARALAMAARLPVLLVEHGTVRQQGRGSKTAKPRALEHPSIPVDAQDVIAMYRVAHESIERARSGDGPTHIVSVPWRLAARSGRRRAARAETPNAVAHLEEWLIARGLPVLEWRQAMMAEPEAKEKTRAPLSAPRSAQHGADGAIEDEDRGARAIA